MQSANSPYITCIIATYNTAHTLPVALASLAKQDLAHVEIIIQDGASSDGTKDVVHEWQDRLPQIRFFSEKDSGIYDAWNKALIHARGEWIFFMGADDICIGSQSLKHVQERLHALGDDVMYLASPVVMRAAMQVPQEGAALYPAKELSSALCHGMALPHQGLFHRRGLFEGRQFSTQYRISGDYEFLLRTYRLGRVAYADTAYISMTVGGVSSALDTMWLCSKEQWQLSRQYFPKALPWKLALRHVRNLGYAVFSRCFGLQRTQYLDDFIRKLRRRPPLWTA